MIRFGRAQTRKSRKVINSYYYWADWFGFNYLSILFPLGLYVIRYIFSPLFLQFISTFVLIRIGIGFSSLFSLIAKRNAISEWIAWSIKLKLFFFDTIKNKRKKSKKYLMKFPMKLMQQEFRSFHISRSARNNQVCKLNRKIFFQKKKRVFFTAFNTSPFNGECLLIAHAKNSTKIMKTKRKEKKKKTPNKNDIFFCRSNFGLQPTETENKVLNVIRKSIIYFCLKSVWLLVDPLCWAYSVRLSSNASVTAHFHFRSPIPNRKATENRMSMLCTQFILPYTRIPAIRLCKTQDGSLCSAFVLIGFSWRMFCINSKLGKFCSIHTERV